MRDGTNPPAGLIADAKGDLFGTTAYGGVNNDGTVFELVKTASATPNKSSTGSAAAQPMGRCPMPA